MTPTAVEINTKIDAEKDSPFVEDHDKMVGHRISFPFIEETVKGFIKGRKRNSDDTLIWTENSNPVLDWRVYNAEIPDESYFEYSYNVLLDNLVKEIL